ncbi:MAG: hypothetical protein SWY16_13715 [Cyanobacteriota bacterium]|nr:hypothetical protein [Cyanobacteriota bacterium]
MENVEGGTEVNLHYINGDVESFNIQATGEEFYQQLQLASERKYLCFHLYDRSVVVNLDKIIKIEIHPPFYEVQGDGVFPTAERITAMLRAARH